MTQAETNRITETALEALKNNISIIPIAADGSKRPPFAWKVFQSQRANPGQVKKWFGSGFNYGLAAIGGGVSKDLEFMDFDNQEFFQRFKDACRATDLSFLLNRIEKGYLEATPNGFHLAWHCPEGVESNQKLAQIMVDGKPKAVIETRGEGGYAIIAPTFGKVHPSGKSYRLINGSVATIQTITAQERKDLLYMARCFNEVLEPAKDFDKFVENDAKETGGRPGDDFNTRATWESVLEPHGWKAVRHYGNGKIDWRRPGKKEGISATTNYAGSGLFYVFSSSTIFQQERGYSKFSTYALLNFNSDFSAAAKELANLGYGEQDERSGAGLDFGGFEGAHVDKETDKVVDGPSQYTRPKLCVQEGDLHLLNPSVWSALAKYNNPPHLFRYAGMLQRFEIDGEKWSLQELNANSMRFEITEAIDWFKIKSTKDEDFEIPAVPPRHIAENLLADSKPQLPTLHKIVETPVFTKEGVLITEPGFHKSGILFHPIEGLVIEPIPPKPSKTDIDRANHLIEELLCDFPFTNNGERTNAISIFIDPFLREMIKGPTPLRLIEASTPGSGKGLLADILTRHATGQPGLITQCHNEEEWNKSLISQLKSNISVILIDNISTVLDSGSLAAALTSEYYGGRLLGTNDTVQWPNRAIWLATANNPTMTTEIARRTVRIRLDPKQDRPWQREDFKHTDLRTWVVDHRPELIWAALTIIQHWIDIGKPAGKNKPLGSFEHWSKSMGGVLEAAGYSDFLSNLEEFYEVADREGTVLRNFVNLWWNRFGDKQTTTSDLFALTLEFDGFDLGKGGDRSQRMVFGKILGRQRDRVIDKFVIRNAGQKAGLTTWKLTIGGQIGF
jgi:hypothetical protein